MSYNLSVKNIAEFSKELRALINKYSIENHGNIPDFALADYLVRCLFAVGVLCQERDKHSFAETQSPEVK